MTTHYDVFNGDADGICALHQLRMAQPVPEAQCVTGIKRDILLLKKIEQVQNCHLTVLDVSLDSNRNSLLQLLENNNSILYVDHHFGGEIPSHQNLATVVDPSPDVCTSLLINSYLEEQYPLWAICGAFGDNLHEQAGKLAASLDLSKQEIEQLREIGELFNYNGYGATVADLHFAPDQLYTQVQPHESPFTFFHDSETMQILREGYASDMEKAMTQPVLFPQEKNRIYQLPDEAWARRVSGVFANMKAREQKDSAHAMLTRNSNTTLRISVRAPLNNKKDADTLCKSFPTGGGRAAAAGINALPEEMFDTFVQQFQRTYP